MIATLTRINPLGVLAATASVSALGSLWFAGLFGPTYARVLGRPYDPRAKMPGVFYLGPLLCNLLVVVTSAFFMKLLAISSLGAAAGFGAMIGVGYLGANAVTMGINPNIPHPLAYGFLSAAYFFLSGVLLSSVLYWVR